MSDKSAFTTFRVVVDADRTVTARLYRAVSPRTDAAVLVLGHGAGAGQESPFIVAFATALAARGIDCVTFNFPYMEAGRRLPDPNAVLESAWRAVLGEVRGRRELTGRRVFAGGKSMGGRIASQVAAKLAQEPAGGETLAGLVFLGYPLHPPGRPDERRDKHLPRINCPMLFVQGERDAFGKAEEMRELVESLPLAELYVVPGANHSLETPKRATPSRAEVMATVQDYVAEWVRTHA